MQRFKVPVRTDSAVEADQALHGAGIPTIGPAMAGFTEATGSRTISDELTAVIEAENPEIAARRVQELVGQECVVGPVEPWGVEAS